jgi:hypothetical protein
MQGIAERSVFLSISIANVFRDFWKGIGLRWAVALSFYVSLGLFTVAANHGFWSEYLRPHVSPTLEPTTFGAGLATGIVDSILSLLGLLAYLAMIARNWRKTVPEAAKNKAHIHALVVALIVVGIGFPEMLPGIGLPGMLSVVNCGFLFFLSAIAALATYLHLQNLSAASGRTSGKFVIVELQMSHSEALELFRTMAQAFIVFVTGLILYAMISLYRSQQQLSPLQEQSTIRGVLLTLYDVAYGIVGYIFLCLGAVVNSLQLIRDRLRELGTQPKR